MSPEHIIIALTIAFLILSLGIHEAAHAWVASLCGDDTAKLQGRLTLNPIPHIDPFMTIILPTVLALSGGMIFGGAKPVPVNYYNLRRPLRDMMLVALAGPAANFVLAVIFLTAEKVLEWQVGMDPRAVAPQVMALAALYNLVLAIFNMIPVPPLDGSRVMAWLLPSSMRESYVRLESIGMLLVFALLLTGALGEVISSTIRPLYEAADFLSGGDWRTP